MVVLWPIARHDPDRLTRYLACGTWLALLGFTIGALGPSSSVSFAPMWILYGLGLAVVSRSRLAAGGAGGRRRRSPPVKVLVVSHLYPSPGVERHLFVHEQNLALRDLGRRVSASVSPTPYAPRVLWRDPRQRRRGQKPRHAVRDGIAAEYPRVPQPPRRLLFDRLGDLAYPVVRRAAVARGGGVDLVHAHQALPDGAARAAPGGRSSACPTW